MNSQLSAGTAGTLNLVASGGRNFFDIKSGAANQGQVSDGPNHSAAILPRPGELGTATGVPYGPISRYGTVLAPPSPGRTVAGPQWHSAACPARESESHAAVTECRPPGPESGGRGHSDRARRRPGPRAPESWLTPFNAASSE
eukprot:767666-Hanusia_phi.AAC.4